MFPERKPTPTAHTSYEMPTSPHAASAPQGQARVPSPGPSPAANRQVSGVSASSALPQRRESNASNRYDPNNTQASRTATAPRTIPGRVQHFADDGAPFASDGFSASYTPRENTIKWAEEIDQTFSIPDDVEARIHFLEKQVRRLSGERSSDPDGTDSRGYIEKLPPTEPSGEVKTPFLRAMPWYEWLQTKSSWDEDSRRIIDLLADDSVLATESMRSKLKSAPPEDAARAEMLEKLLKTKTQPERIRINSWYLQRWLELVSGNDRLAPLDRPFVLLRPFKILKYHEKALRDEHERLKNRWESPDANEQYPIEDDGSTDCQQSFLDLGCLIKFMDDFVTPLHWTTDDDPAMIPHSKLWYLLRPGLLVYSKDRKMPQKIWKIISRTGGRKYLSRPENLAEGRTWQGKYSPFVVHCYRLDHDGNEFVRIERQFSIDYFDGIQPLTSLPLFPLHAAQKDGLINLQDIIDRGELFVECISRRFRNYSGQSHWGTPDGEKLKNPEEQATGVPFVIPETIDSQVMVDFRRTFQMVPEWRPMAHELPLYTTDVAEMKEDSAEEQECIERDVVWDGRLREDFVDSESAKMRDWVKPGHHPAGEDLLLLPDRVFGFVFRTRKWACLQLRTGVDGKGDLQKIATKSEGWDDLKLAGDHRNIIQSLMSAHFEKNEATELEFDLVKNKGKSMVILLHGPPGVGKTSTAECVAEFYRKPLLPITCGDLGTSAQDVENKLQANFQLATAWNCVLLLDEADIFLAQRTTSDVKRNALVSVFLRVLEYYEGILFLTTNRIGAFDEAFKSRCHMALYYPPLSLDQTKAIWESHVDRAHRKLGENVDIDKDDVLDYAEFLWKSQSVDKRLGTVWNGRQIRNAFQSALALARYEVKDEKVLTLKIKYLRRVADVSSDFSEYLFNAHGHRTEADRMRTNHMRADNHTKDSAMQYSGGSVTAAFGSQNMGQSPQASSSQSYAPTQRFNQMQTFQPQSPTQNFQPAFQGMAQYSHSPPAQQPGFASGQGSLGHNGAQASPPYGSSMAQAQNSMVPGYQSTQGQPNVPLAAYP